MYIDTCLLAETQKPNFQKESNTFLAFSDFCEVTSKRVSIYIFCYALPKPLYKTTIQQQKPLYKVIGSKKCI